MQGGAKLHDDYFNLTKYIHKMYIYTLLNGKYIVKQ